jgi:hypothetical protein
MAIDSATKRASALSVGIIALSLVVPSGTVDQQAKQTVTNVYSGILATPPVSTPDSTFAVFGAIQERGKSVLSEVNVDGQGVLASMVNSFAVSSTIQDRGKSVTGTINPDGQGVSGEI